MEYFIGSIMTIITIAFCNKMFNKKIPKPFKSNVEYSQSRLVEIMKPVQALYGLITILNKEKLVTQTTKHYDSQHVRVIISDTEAYWISNNKFYTASVEGSKIIEETTKEVDTMTMDDVQLNKIIEIVEMLGGNDDSSGTGNKGF